jgi:radical SAM-linked protein
VQRLRLRYAKRGRLRFSSHRDFQRALERALRRCQVPMAYSAGFHPRPKISYAGAAPTGTASEAEYVDLGVTHRLDPDAVREALDAALPPGLDIVDMVEAGCQSLADLLQASLWQFTFSTLGPDQAVAVMRRFSALTEAPVQRVTKAGRRSVDTRAAVLHWTVAAEGVTPRDRPGGSDLDGPCAILHLVVRHTTPSVRPDDILTALRSSAGLAPAACAGAARSQSAQRGRPVGRKPDAVDGFGRREPAGDAHRGLGRLPPRPPVSGAGPSAGRGCGALTGPTGDPWSMTRTMAPFALPRRSTTG